MKTEITLGMLLKQRISAKQAEDEAIAERRGIDKLIVDAMPGADEGTVSEALDGYKVSVTRKISRKVDTAKLKGAWEFIPENVQKAFKWSADLELKHFRALQQLATDELNKVAEFITSEPASPSIKVELIKD